MGDFGLSGALGDEGTAELVRRQREVALAYGELEVVARQTAWLIEHGYETPSDTEGLRSDGRPDVDALLGAAPDWTGGLSVDEYMAEQRRERADTEDGSRG